MKHALKQHTPKQWQTAQIKSQGERRQGRQVIIWTEKEHRGLGVWPAPWEICLLTLISDKLSKKGNLLSPPAEKPKKWAQGSADAYQGTFSHPLISWPCSHVEFVLRWFFHGHDSSRFRQPWSWWSGSLCRCLPQPRKKAGYSAWVTYPFSSFQKRNGCDPERIISKHDRILINDDMEGIRRWRQWWKGIFGVENTLL